MASGRIVIPIQLDDDPQLAVIVGVLDLLAAKLNEQDQDLAAIVAALTELGSSVAAVRTQNNKILTRENQIMLDLTNLQASVTANGEVDASAIVLLEQLSQMIRDAATDPAAVQAIADQLDAQKADLAAAIVANTPAG